MHDSSARPARRRRPGWEQPFLAAIRSSGNIRLAADAAGIDRSTPYQRARRDPAFADAWAAAQEDAIDVLEGIARKRAVEGSDALLMFLLRAHRPQLYRERIDVHVDVRREAERIAAKTGISVDELLAAAERRARELP